MAVVLPGQVAVVWSTPQEMAAADWSPKQVEEVVLWGVVGT